MASFVCSTICVNNNAALASAIGGHDKDLIAKARATRQDHLNKQKGERGCYYRRRELGADPHHDSISIILDKWDSSKSTSPYFPRAPGSWWKDLKHDVLQQHVLGVLVHGKPQHSVFLCTPPPFTIPKKKSGAPGLSHSSLNVWVCVQTHSMTP